MWRECTQLKNEFLFEIFAAFSSNKSLQLVHNFAARILLGLKKFDRISKLLNSLPVNGELYLNDATMMFRRVKKPVPGYVTGINSTLTNSRVLNLQTLSVQNFAAHILLGLKEFDRISKLLNSLPANGELQSQ